MAAARLIARALRAQVALYWHGNGLTVEAVPAPVILPRPLSVVEARLGVRPLDW
jgi:hypothetical protein